MEETDEPQYQPGSESMDALLERHEREISDLQEIIKTNLKSAKKKDKAIVEAQMLQLQYDLKAKQREEESILEEYLEKGGDIISSDPKPVKRDENIAVETSLSKKEKALRKKVHVCPPCIIQF